MVGPDEPTPRLQVDNADVPSAGVYANLVTAWCTGYEVTAEFAVSLPLGGGSDPLHAVQVARVKMPPRVAWDLARQLSNQVALWEENFGRFTPDPMD